MLVSEFDFDLPEELIAQEAPPRGASRLLVVDRSSGAIQHAAIGDLPRYLRSGDLLVLNNTRVFAARLLGQRVPSGGAVECLLLEQHPPATPAPSRTSSSAIWSALVHPGQKLKPGARVRFEGEAGALIAEVLERHFHGRRTIRLSAESGGDIDELIDALGHMPLPPYIKRPDRAADRERYQTVYAAVRGSVAAPTAGLHFTRALLDTIDAAGIARAEITLHVGYGTFKPVRSTRVEEHVVDPERYHVSEAASVSINRALDEGRRIVVVGTTTTRALEDAALRGRGRVLPGAAETSLFIYPGFTFQVLGGMVTNFHVPQSSLLMLVAAFAGRDRVMGAYRAAIAARYRFYSYGDAMLVL